MNISGNTIFIPGATSGIGLALALRLKAAGNTVIVGGRRSSLLEALAADHGLDTVTIDTTDPASVLAARDQVVARHPGLNVLVAMAGIMTPEDVRGADFLATAERVVDTNITGPLRLISAFLGQLESQPDSTLVTVSSGLAHLPLAPFPTYNGTKAFIHRFSESIRLQLAGTSVKVVELVPPAVQTELVPGNSQNEHFMPLDAFADEVMAILEARPDVAEVLVDAVRVLRFAEVEGRFDATVAAMNAAV
jgi:uncharacterized oxidoreductase